MILPDARVGPYVRALAGGLFALAPNTDWPPLEGITAHLRALDPLISGRLLAPAEVDERTGMPAFPWFERVNAEAELAAERPERRDDADLLRVARMDRDLADRLRWRRDLHAHVLEHPVFPTSRASARARRLGKRTEVLVTVDRVLPQGLWSRVSLVLAAPAGTADLGAARVGSQGRIRLDPGLLHLISRHAATPLLALRAQVAAVTEGEVRRVCRATLGPFWFPGVALPEEAPPELGRGLLLHCSHEVVADDVFHSGSRDALAVEDGLAVPDGHGLVRDRRFAASASVRPALQAFCSARGVQAEIVPIG